MNPLTPSTILPLSIYERLYGAYANWSTVPFIALPLAIFAWSFKTSQSYYQDNETFNTTIQEIIDSQTFKKIVTPLYRYINGRLTEDIIKVNQLPTTGTPQDIIEQTDLQKAELVKGYDFSYLEEAIEFQDSIGQIIKTKRDQIALKNAIKKSRLFLIATTISSFVNLILGFGLQGTYVILGFKNPITVLIFILWGLALICSFIFIICFYCFKTKIEKMRYE